jgi:hypothetical protein
MALYKGVCYPTVQDARNAACSDHYHVFSASGALTREWCINSTGSTAMMVQREVNGSSSYSVINYPYMPSCNHSGGVDYAAYWMGAALLLFVTLFGIRRLIELFSATDK